MANLEPQTSNSNAIILEKSIKQDVIDNYSVDIVNGEIHQSNPNTGQHPHGANNFNLNQIGRNGSQIEEIPEPIKVLDDIILEFEEAARPPMGLNGENQSEDDGYMSLSRKNMCKHYVDLSSANGVEENPETSETNFQHCDTFDSTNSMGKQNEITCKDVQNDQSIAQTTLPKVRANSVSRANYSSLPCNGVRSSMENKMRGGERNALGIDINAVHKAVLQGVFSKLPESIVNEHPVTIYPGRESPPESSRSKKSQRLISSVKKHKEVCQILNPLSSMCSSSSSSSYSAEPSEYKSLPIPKNNTYNKTNIPTYESKNDTSNHESSEDFLTNHVNHPGHNGIAWEIQFKTNSKKKSKSAMKKKDLKNVFHEDVKYTKSKNVEEFSKACLLQDTDEMLNVNHFNVNSMLGKGTFVIRKSLKKPPEIIEIFDRPHYLEQTLLPASASEIPDAAYLEARHNEELNVPNTPFISSPRDRLSLDIEPQTLTTSKNCGINNKISPEEQFSKLLSLESINSESPDDVPNNGADACNIFSYNQKYSDIHTTNTTPHTDLAPTIEESEEQFSDFSYECAPLHQIENNISALLRGDISVVRIRDISQTKRPLEFRPGVHKSESAKEMLLSQNAFGPLPPSPPPSSALYDYDALPPLPPSPTENFLDNDLAAAFSKASVKPPPLPSTDELKTKKSIKPPRKTTEDFFLPSPKFDIPPAVPPHRCPSINTLKSRSIDSNYKRKSPKLLGYSGSGITTPTQLPLCDGAYTTKRYMSYGTKRSLKQSPREEHRLQTSCSLPETPIFARGCDIPRTPYRRQPESTASGSRTAPRSSTSHNMNIATSIIGIGATSVYGTGICRQRSINHALASNEMLRLSGVPARGWYPKQRTMRPASTENIDRLTSIRVWDSAAGMSGTGHSRKPLTLPPNLTPSFLNKSPREALRRVTSLLIAKKKNTKERKKKPYSENAIDSNPNICFDGDINVSQRKALELPTIQKPQKKKNIFKNFWKRTKHISLDQ